VNYELYRQKRMDRLLRQLKRSRQAKALEDDQFQQQRINSARIYSRKLKYLRQFTEED